MKFNTSLLNAMNSDIKQRILMHYFTHDIPLSERELASILKVSHMSINRLMHEFEDMNLAIYIRAGNSHLWQLNKKSYSYNALFEIFQDRIESLNPIKDLIKIIKFKLPDKVVEKVILFGSIAEKTEETNSDIDLYILIKKEKDKDLINNWLNELSEICLARYGNPLAPYVLTKSDYRKKFKVRIIQQINKGIQIYPVIK